MTTSSPVDSHAIELIDRLAREASALQTFNIETTGLGNGLPEKVPVGFNAKEQRFLSLKTSIEEFRLTPDRRRGTASVDTLKSFIELIDRHKDDRSAIFAKTSYPDPKLTAVLNYDQADGDARHGDHRIVYPFPLTDEFKAWIAGDMKSMDQAEFAAFLEDHASELAAPMDGEKSTYEQLFKEAIATPSEVLQLSRQLEVFVASKAKQGIRLQTGERVVEFSEEHQGANGEKIVIPGIFMVSVPAFVDGDAVRIPARLRYRLPGGNIKWHYQLYRWQNFLREEVEHNLLEAGEKTGLPTFQGAPEARS